MKSSKNAFRKNYVPGNATGYWNSRNQRRLEKKNKDVSRVSNTKQMGTEREKEKST